MRGLLLAGALAAAAGCAGGFGGSHGPAATLCAHLEGAGESSDALDPVHQGDATLELSGTEIRFTISAPGLPTVVATHIHHGEAGTNGPMFWEINPGYKGDSVRGRATDVPPGVVALIARDPSEYYLKLHTVKFPGGAIRGQLRPCPVNPATR